MMTTTRKPCGLIVYTHEIRRGGGSMRLETVVVEVTAEDIAAGYAGDFTKCPMSLAINRAFPLYYATVGLTHFTLWSRHNSGHSGIIALPKTALDFRKRFDRHEPTNPFTFDIEIDSQFIATEEPTNE